MSKETRHFYVYEVALMYTGSFCKKIISKIGDF